MKIFFIPFVAFFIYFSFSCTKPAGSGYKKESYYYYGDKKIEIIIHRDTLGILLSDAVRDPIDSSKLSFDTVKKNADSILQSEGYPAAGYLTKTGDIKLVKTPKKKNKNGFFYEKYTQQLKDTHKNFILNAGYLARIKETGLPIFITNEIVIQFKPGTSDTSITKLFNEYGLVMKKKNQFVPYQYTVFTTDSSSYDALETTHKLKGNTNLIFADINLIYIKNFDSGITDEPLFKKQWQFVNNGSSGLKDADIDAELAWQYTLGSRNTIIAIIDDGFDIEHEDLKNKYSHNIGEIPQNNIDDDGNGCVDDVIGWNFVTNTNDLTPADGHGTAVAGIAAAEYNGMGVVGSCPGCGILPLRTRSGSTGDDDAHAIEYAGNRGAKIINCSWNTSELIPILNEAIDRAISGRISIFCAVTDDHINDCDLNTLSSNESTIAISASDRFDKFAGMGFGYCLDLLAPGAIPFANDCPKITTTDISGPEGYSTGMGDRRNCNDAAPDDKYTPCFWGTSAAAPLAAGVGGLIVSVDPSITPKQLQYLLQDCADKIEPSQASYSPINGKSLANTHGYGRLNAFEAVRIAAPVNNGTNRSGLGGVDIFLRDNELDWGNTEQPSSTLFESPRSDIGWWRSQDIKVDAFPYQTGIPSNPVINTSTEFDRLNDENLGGGISNRVYVRVHNRGYNKIDNAIVKLHWTDACFGFPDLPDDFWDKFPKDASDVTVWHPIGIKTILNLTNSGSSAAKKANDEGAETDGSQIVVFEFTAPVHDPSKPDNHYCLMALVSTVNDPMPTDFLKNPLNLNRLNMDFVTTHFNNATHRNYEIRNEQPFSAQFSLYNPYPYLITTKIETESGKKISLVFEDSLMTKEFVLKKGEKKSVFIKINPGELSKPEEITIRQLLIGKKKGEKTIMGGFTYLIKPSDKKMK